MRLYNVVHILVGTPGRVLDLADKGIANLKECSTLIMDEVSVLFRFLLNIVSLVNDRVKQTHTGACVVTYFWAQLLQRQVQPAHCTARIWASSQ